MHLPVTYLDGFHLDIQGARDYGMPLADAYQLATPYPHVVVDDLFPPDIVARLCREFPSAEVDHYLYDIGYRGSLKRQYSPENCSSFCRQFFQLLNSAPFLEFLGAVSGISGVLGDPYFEGGGFHEILPGGKLGIHRDFRIHKRLSLLRRLNVILYLNEGWEHGFGGDLELWSRDMQRCVRKVAPVMNRCVIFATDDCSFHGHPDPLSCPSNRSRRSLAMYYYTASENIFDEVPSRRTHFVARPGETEDIRIALREAQVNSVT
ncbi:2OG-Fe(II) oxygenase [Pandoraea pnomenusa]|uniref:2OG-Fe(II) oxygenase n=1 Tax=Pandoraea TaxID=93217 RepID=UPI001198C838|nr:MULTISPECIES: 2OG-Fe(II) oxygenase [Pandoraea]MDM8359544.1 2OG-Fe(II) oxygenase [Pandoraea communis]QDX23576.1 2OG-Fe(II) oxygenase [Pandoraea pnomenusa]